MRVDGEENRGKVKQRERIGRGAEEGKGEEGGGGREEDIGGV